MESDARAPPREVAVSESDAQARPQEAAAEAVLDAAVRLPEEAAPVVGRGGGAAAGGGGVGAWRGGGAAAGGGGAGAGRGGGAAAGGGGVGAGRVGAAAGGGAPFGGGCCPLALPSSSLACARTSGAVCACDAKLASCVTDRAVVASSTMRRFVMMSFGPRKRPGSNGSAVLTYQLVDQQLIIRPDYGGLQIARSFLFHESKGLRGPSFIARSDGAFKVCFKVCIIRSPDRWLGWAFAGHSAHAPVARLASRPGNSRGWGGRPGSCTGGGTSGRGRPGGSSRGGSVGCPGVAGGTSGGSIGIASPGLQVPGAITATRASSSRMIQ
ncbi:hypothetical protein V1290_003700 [Bradyrhizobium sp. AZCC 1578]